MISSAKMVMTNGALSAECRTSLNSPAPEDMSSFDRWFRCKISTRQREQIEREDQESGGGGGRRRPQQIIQLAAAAGGTLQPRTVVNTPTGASLAILRGPVEVRSKLEMIVGVKWRVLQVAM